MTASHGIRESFEYVSHELLKLSERGQYPTFRMNNIENGYMIANKMKFLNLDRSIFERYKLEKGDLLFNRTNSSDLACK